MCRGDWYLVPYDIRGRIWATWRPGEAAFSPEHQRVVHQAIALAQAARSALGDSRTWRPVPGSKRSRNVVAVRGRDHPAGEPWTASFQVMSRHRRHRLVPFARNRSWLGKLKASGGETGYPVIQLMTVCETGTRALIGAVFGTTAEGELASARRLLHLLDDTMLVLMDRGFDAGRSWPVSPPPQAHRGARRSPADAGTPARY